MTNVPFHSDLDEEILKKFKSTITKNEKIKTVLEEMMMKRVKEFEDGS